MLQAELNALAVGGSRLNKQGLQDANGKYTQEFHDVLNKSSGMQATSASALQQLQSQVNKSSFNNTTTQEEAQIAGNQTQNNTKSTNENKVASSNQDAHPDQRSNILDNCRSGQTIGAGEAVNQAAAARRGVDALGRLVEDLEESLQDNAALERLQGRA